MTVFKLISLMMLTSAATLLTPFRSAAEEVTGERISKSVDLAIALIEASSATYLEQRQCFSCHHQAMPLLALTKAKQRDFKVDDENLKAQLARTHDHLKKGQDNYLKGKGQGGKADTAGYALWALEAGNSELDETTSAVTEYLLRKNKDEEHWTSSSNRPPSEDSDVTTTAISLYGLRAFGTHEQLERIKAKRQKTTQWLLKFDPNDTEERVFLLHALSYLEPEGEQLGEQVAKSMKATAQTLIASQGEDGGWAQTKDLESDAYATGTALVALREVFELPIADAVYQRGIQFLLDTQLEDGSWHVVSRSDPFQTYFESGFPHGDDQFISMSATCWATYALVLAK